VSRILIITPASRQSRVGNRITADRWATILRSLNHRLKVDDRYDDQPCDILIALHARKSAAAVERFAAKHPRKPLIVALTGTDLYSDIHNSPAAQRSLEFASRLVLLQPHGQHELQRRFLPKVRVIYQSANAPTQSVPRLKRVFEICVSGHLRPVKDPLRAALAARRLPPDSRAQITHVGAALSESLERRALAEVRKNSRYRWLGEVSRAQALRLLSRSRLMVLSSKMEGGANVVTEALVAGVPILSTHISGSIGLLGKDYPGYFQVGDTRGLAELMFRCETDPNFYHALKTLCHQQSRLLAPRHERAAWAKLIREFEPYA